MNFCLSVRQTDRVTDRHSDDQRADSDMKAGLASATPRSQSWRPRFRRIGSVSAACRWCLGGVGLSPFTHGFYRLVTT